VSQTRISDSPSPSEELHRDIQRTPPVPGQPLTSLHEFAKHCLQQCGMRADLEKVLEARQQQQIQQDLDSPHTSKPNDAPADGASSSPWRRVKKLLPNITQTLARSTVHPYTMDKAGSSCPPGEHHDVCPQQSIGKEIAIPVAAQVMEGDPVQRKKTSFAPLLADGYEDDEKPLLSGSVCRRLDRPLQLKVSTLASHTPLVETCVCVHIAVLYLVLLLCCLRTSRSSSLASSERQRPVKKVATRDSMIRIATKVFWSRTVATNGWRQQHWTSSATATSIGQQS
jgi:hypothetical protein